MSFFITNANDPRISGSAFVDRAYMTSQGSAAGQKKAVAGYSNKTVPLSSTDNYNFRWTLKREVDNTSPTLDQYSLSSQRLGESDVLDSSAAGTNTDTTYFGTRTVPSTSNSQRWEIKATETAATPQIFDKTGLTRVYYTGNAAEPTEFMPPSPINHATSITVGVEFSPVNPSNPSRKQLYVASDPAQPVSTFPLANVVTPTPAVSQFVLSTHPGTGPVITGCTYFLTDNNGWYLTLRPDPTVSGFFTFIPQAYTGSDNQKFTFVPASVPSATNPFFSYFIKSTLVEPSVPQRTMWLSIVETPDEQFFVDGYETDTPGVWEEFQLRPTLEHLGRFKLLCPYWTNGRCVKSALPVSIAEVGTATTADVYFGLQVTSYNMCDDFDDGCDNGGDAHANANAIGGDEDEDEESSAFHDNLIYHDPQAALDGNARLLATVITDVPPTTEIPVREPIGLYARDGVNDVQIDNLYYTQGAAAAVAALKKKNGDDKEDKKKKNKTTAVAECPAFYYNQKCGKGEKCPNVHRVCLSEFIRKRQRAVPANEKRQRAAAADDGDKDPRFKNVILKDERCCRVSNYMVRELLAGTKEKKDDETRRCDKLVEREQRCAHARGQRVDPEEARKAATNEWYAGRKHRPSKKESEQKMIKTAKS